MDVLTNHNRKKGIVTWYLGPMFAGKTDQLVHDYRRSIHANQNSFIFKSASDTRYSLENVCSHDGVQVNAIPVNDSSELFEEYITRNLERRVRNVFVDEAIFLDSGIIKVSRELVTLGTNVYLAALNLTSSGKPFPFSDGKGTVADFVSIVDVYQSFTAVCYKCPFPATRSQKLKKTGQTVNVGGKEMYAPACVDHWIPRE